MNLKEYNNIQIKLILMSNLEPELWIEKYSLKFREIVNRGIIDIDKIIKEIYK